MEDSEGKASITTQTKSIYDYLQATIDEKMQVDLIYNDADFVRAWTHSLMKMDKQCLHLAIFACTYAGKSGRCKHL